VSEGGEAMLFPEGADPFLFVYKRLSKKRIVLITIPNVDYFSIDLQCVFF